jgi:molybdopterin adenylyltransferase
VPNSVRAPAAQTYASPNGTAPTPSRNRNLIGEAAGVRLARDVSELPFLPLAVAVVTISDTRDLDTDSSGALIVELLTAAGHQIVERQLVRDDLLVIRERFAKLRDAAAVQVVIATGGTGITARDVTPEALEPLVTKPIVGFGELFRSLSYEQIGPSTMQSRATAALCDQTLFFVLPGSRGAVRLALEQIILPQLDRRTKPCNFAELMPRF